MKEWNDLVDLSQLGSKLHHLGVSQRVDDRELIDLLGGRSPVFNVDSERRQQQVLAQTG